MKRKRYSEEQITGVLKEVVVSLAELCRKHGIFDAAFHIWQYGGIGNGTAAVPGGGESQAAEAAGRYDAREELLENILSTYGRRCCQASGGPLRAQSSRFEVAQRLPAAGPSSIDRALSVPPW